MLVDPPEPIELKIIPLMIVESIECSWYHRYVPQSRKQKEPEEVKRGDDKLMIAMLKVRHPRTLTGAGTMLATSGEGVLDIAHAHFQFLKLLLQGRELLRHILKLSLPIVTLDL
jgi:hypothetical protein